MDIKGLSIQDIIDMDWKDISKLNTQELKQLSMRLNSVANKRLRRLEQSGQSKWSPAYAHIKKSGGDFSVKGKDTKKDLKAEIQRASDFIRAKTSTAEGSKEYKKNVEEIFKGKQKPPQGESPDQEKTSPDTDDIMDEDVDIEDMSEMQRKKLFRALDRLRESNAAAVYNIGSDIIIKELRKSQLADKRKSRDRLVEELESKFPELTEDSEARYVREQNEIQNREDEDGQFRTLSAQEELDNPWKNR